MRVHRGQQRGWLLHSSIVGVALTAAALLMARSGHLNLHLDRSHAGPAAGGGATRPTVVNLPAVVSTPALAVATPPSAAPVTAAPAPVAVVQTTPPPTPAATAPPQAAAEAPAPPAIAAPTPEPAAEEPPPPAPAVAEPAPVPAPQPAAVAAPAPVAQSRGSTAISTIVSYLRPSPSTDAMIVGSIPPGTPVTVLGCSAGCQWLLVQPPGGGPIWSLSYGYAVQGGTIGGP